MDSLEDYIGKEVFLAGPGDHGTGEGGDLHAEDDFMQMVEYLKNKDIDIEDPGLMVVHGVLTSAETVPSELKDSPVFVVITHPDRKDRGIIAESAASKSIELARQIERLLEMNGGVADIEDLYILYGYPMTVCFALNDEDLDEEAIATCKELADRAANIPHIEEK